MDMQPHLQLMADDFDSKADSLLKHLQKLSSACSTASLGLSAQASFAMNTRNTMRSTSSISNLRMNAAKSFRSSHGRLRSGIQPQMEDSIIIMYSPVQRRTLQGKTARSSRMFNHAESKTKPAAMPEGVGTKSNKCIHVDTPLSNKGKNQVEISELACSVTNLNSHNDSRISLSNGCTNKGSAIPRVSKSDASLKLLNNSSTSGSDCGSIGVGSGGGSGSGSSSGSSGVLTICKVESHLQNGPISSGLDTLKKDCLQVLDTAFSSNETKLFEVSPRPLVPERPAIAQPPASLPERPLLQAILLRESHRSAASLNMSNMSSGMLSVSGSSCNESSSCSTSSSSLEGSVDEESRMSTPPKGSQPGSMRPACDHVGTPRLVTSQRVGTPRYRDKVKPQMNVVPLNIDFGDIIQHDENIDVSCNRVAIKCDTPKPDLVNRITFGERRTIGQSTPKQINPAISITPLESKKSWHHRLSIRRKSTSSPKEGLHQVMKPLSDKKSWSRRLTLRQVNLIPDQKVSDKPWTRRLSLSNDVSKPMVVKHVYHDNCRGEQQKDGENKENKYEKKMIRSVSTPHMMNRKRKRHRTDDDCLSLQSVDISLEEPKKRRRSSLARMSSLTNLLSPIKPVRKVGQALQKSLSLRNLMSPSPSKYHVTAYKKPAPTPPKRRASSLWHETVNDDTKQKYNQQQIERQEAIYELFRCEEDLIQDLEMVKTTYHDSMAKLKLMTDDELKQIFGPITILSNIHEVLAEGLRDQRLPDGTTDSIGEVLLKWVPRLKEYIPYCSNQVYAKALLDLKKQDPAVDDFLQRCRDSPFSRRLDLWSFLDVPRSRLVKYPLLFKAIQKKTPVGHPDVALIGRTLEVIAEIIAEVDKKTGEAKCELTRSKLEFLDQSQKHPLIDESDVILCDGILKNNRGTKLYVFLFEKIMVITRAATRGQQLRYQVYRNPIPVADLILDELQDGQGGKSGSFRSAFIQNQTGKNMFKVSLKNGGKGQSHTLQANDEHDKRQWIQCLREVLPKENIIEVHSEEDSKENGKTNKENKSLSTKEKDSLPTKETSKKESKKENSKTNKENKCIATKDLVPAKESAKKEAKKENKTGKENKSNSVKEKDSLPAKESSKEKESKKENEVKKENQLASN